MRDITVVAKLHADSPRYTAESQDIPGFVTEAESIEEVLQHVRDLAPILFEQNGVAMPEGPIRIRIITESEERFAVA